MTIPSLFLADTQSVRRSDFGENFRWGVSTAAYQVEGGYRQDGRGISIWDVFAKKRGKIKNNHNGNIACDFYNRYQDDLQLMRLMGIPNFRFSISWPRVLPYGTGRVNNKGLDFYDRLIDSCLAKKIEPWVTLYHWDLPDALQQKGGWANREILNWFSEYVSLCATRYGDRVKHWMVLNEPVAFTGAGYFLGMHAPGKKGMNNFLPALHHAALCQSAGGRILRSLASGAEIGTTYSISPVEPLHPTERHANAAARVDALLNRLFIEPALGLGYPVQDLHFLQRLENFYRQEDDTLLPFEFDFIGVQTYTREIVRHSFITPAIKARLVNAQKRGVPVTEMNWEIHPPSIYHTLKKIGSYSGVRKLYVTENGAAFPDVPVNNKVHDPKRIEYLQTHLAQVLKAKKEGVNVEGYFVWSFLDNFEWAQGYRPRFGLVYVDYATQKRIVKESGKWYSRLLET